MTSSRARCSNLFRENRVSVEFLALLINETDAFNREEHPGQTRKDSEKARAMGEAAVWRKSGAMFLGSPAR